MLWPRIGGLFKFLLGILLLQGATALLTYIALKTDCSKPHGCLGRWPQPWAF